MQAACMGDTGEDTCHRKRRGKKASPSPLLDPARNSAFERVLIRHLTADFAGELIEEFARDYAEDGRDHALAELLFSVRELNTDYERLAAGAALESLAGRIEAGIREYPNLVRAAKALADDVPPKTPGDNSEREGALRAARTVIRPIAAELSKRTG